MAPAQAIRGRAEEVRASGTHSRGLAVVLVAAGGVRAAAVAGQPSRFYLDSKGYLAVAGEPLSSLDFFAGERPWALPLLYKLVPASDAWRVAAHVGVAIAGWSALAIVVWRAVDHPLVRWGATLAVLGLSLSPPVIQWDPLLISESLTLSLGAAAVAAWLAFARTGSRAAAVAVVAVTVGWVFTRDSHAYLAVLLAPIGLAVAWRQRADEVRRTIVVFGLVAVVGVLSLASTTTEQARLRRWERPLLHVLGERIIPDPAARAWFERRGMPVSPELLAVAPRLGHRPAPPEFERWVRTEARSLYPRYLVTHPRSSVARVVDERDEVIDRMASGYHLEDTERVLPVAVEHVLFPPRFEIVALLYVALGAAAWRWRRHGPAPLLWVVVIGLGLLAFHSALAVHGDAMELDRHAVGISVGARILLILLAAFVADAALGPRPRFSARPLRHRAVAA